MKFLTPEGNLTEGTPLSPDEQKIYEVLMENVRKAGSLPGHHVYLSGAENMAVVLYLMTTFHISYRVKPSVKSPFVSKTENDDSLQYPAPIAVEPLSTVGAVAPEDDFPL